MVDLVQFVGNPDAYAVQNADGTYTPVRTPISSADLDTHAEGSETYGTYVVWYDKARFMVFDIDDHDLALAKAIAAECQTLGFHPGIEFSGRKGFHVWVLLDGWTSAADVQRVAKHIARQVGFKGEVFPKQAVARDLGSLVKLPTGVHAVTGNASRFIQEPSLDTVQTLTNALHGLPPEPVSQSKGGGKLPCLDSIQDNPPANGERNNLYFHFAAHLRRMGLHAEAIEAVLRELWLDPDPGELEGVVQNSEFSGPTCDQVPDERHCGDRCIKKQARGLSVRPGQLRNAQDGELIVVEVGPNKTKGSILRSLKHPDAAEAAVVMKEREKS